MAMECDLPHVNGVTKRRRIISSSDDDDNNDDDTNGNSDLVDVNQTSMKQPTISIQSSSSSSSATTAATATAKAATAATAAAAAAVAPVVIQPKKKARKVVQRGIASFFGGAISDTTITTSITSTDMIVNHSLHAAAADDDEHVIDGQQPSASEASTSTPSPTITIEEYNPSAENYHPVTFACWKMGEAVPYGALTCTMGLIEETSSRLKIVEILSNFLRSVIALLSPGSLDLVRAVYLFANAIAPAYENIELGIGDATLISALSSAAGRSVANIKSEFSKHGDLGVVAERSVKNLRRFSVPKKLTVSRVFDHLSDIARVSGKDSNKKKASKIIEMLIACSGSEARYLIRLLSGKLRIGLANASVIAALGRAVALTSPGEAVPTSDPIIDDAMSTRIANVTLQIKTAFCECPTYDKVIATILDTGVNSLSEFCTVVPGVPVKPMLAHPTKGISEVLSRFEGHQFVCEYKYDGERAQVHVLPDGSVCIYSRNSENNTSKYPDIVARMKDHLAPGVDSVILDCEAVAWDPVKKHILPFQVLSTRKRKDASAGSIQVEVCLFAFDLVYLNGKSQVREPLETRRSLLRENVIEDEGRLMFATHMVSSDTADIDRFLEESIQGNCEGLMVKCLQQNATYEIAKRSHNWLKLKKDYLDGVGDTLDLVVIGAWVGKGKRTGVYGAFLLACYDSDSDVYQSICKIGTGFSDEDLKAHHTTLCDHIIETPASDMLIADSITPDVWFNPQIVWEVKTADLSISPAHKAAIGLVDSDKGISLRFPRFLRVRDDKKSVDATSAEQVADMYQKQNVIANARNIAGGEDLEDDY